MAVHLFKARLMLYMLSSRVAGLLHGEPDFVSTCFLVGGFNLSEKYEFVNWDDEIPNLSQSM